jgi:hypothetical protein
MAASGQPSNKWILSNASDESSSASPALLQTSSAADSSGRVAELWASGLICSAA